MKHAQKGKFRSRKLGSGGHRGHSVKDRVLPYILFLHRGPTRVLTATGSLGEIAVQLTGWILKQPEWWNELLASSMMPHRSP